MVTETQASTAKVVFLGAATVMVLGVGAAAVWAIVRADRRGNATQAELRTQARNLGNVPPPPLKSDPYAATNGNAGTHTPSPDGPPVDNRPRLTPEMTADQLGGPKAAE